MKFAKYWCSFFGHDWKQDSVVPHHDVDSIYYVCERCGGQKSNWTRESAPKYKKLKKIALLILPFLVYGLLTVADDVDSYYANINSDSCCGWFEKGSFTQPYTNVMLSLFGEWSEPEWQMNAARSQEWLVQDVLVNGQVEFWTILEKRDPATKLPITVE